MSIPKFGVIAVQGAVSEHLAAVRGALAEMEVAGEAIPVRRPEHTAGLKGIVLPGGESTTISKLLIKFGLHERLRTMASEGVPIMGTCAGMVLLATEGDREVERTDTRLLGLLDMRVERNAFGRQRESFEAMLDIEGMDAPYPGIFIRAPAVLEARGDCRVLARFDDRIVAVRRDHIMALAFHPELSGDWRLHRLFVQMGL